MLRSKNLFRTLTVSVLLLFPAAGAAAGDGDEERHRPLMAFKLGDCLGSEGVPRGFLGVETTSLTPELRAHFGVSGDAGILISRVVEDSPAAAAGIEVGDVVTRVDGEAIEKASDLSRAIRAREGGEVVDIDYSRDGRPGRATATLEARERCAFDVGHILEGIDFEHLKELGNLGHHLGDFELGDIGFEIDSEALEEALSKIGETFESQDWEQHFEALQNLNLEQIEERMEDVQRRLEELEVRLEHEHERLGDRHRELARRERERAERQRERVEQDRERIERQARERAVRERRRVEEEPGVEVEELEEDGGGVY